VSMYTLVLGGEVLVPTLTGEASMRVPPETQNEQLMRLSGKGMPRQGGGYGDEYVRLVARLPQNLDDRARELFRELSSIAPA
jgi:DnaJ-class molecular chaperone